MFTDPPLARVGLSLGSLFTNVPLNGAASARVRPVAALIGGLSGASG